MLAAIALPLWAVAARATNAPEEWLSAVPSGGDSVVVGALQSLSVDRCQLAFQVQVTADPGGGTDSFRLEIYDEGALVRTVALEVPADGGVHTVSGVVGLPPISQVNPGIGVALFDETLLDVEDPFPAACAPFEIPAASPAGFAGLGALLLLAGLVLVRRRTRNP